MNELWLIGLMAALTFGPRYLPFALAGRVRIPPLLQRALKFVPIAVLTAIIAQSTLIHDGQLALSADNHHLPAALIAFLVALRSGKLGWTVLAGLVSYGLLLVAG